MSQDNNPMLHRFRETDINIKPFKECPRVSVFTVDGVTKYSFLKHEFLDECKYIGCGRMTNAECAMQKQYRIFMLNDKADAKESEC